MKRRSGWSLLFLALIVVPLVEIVVIIQVGQVIGPWWTIALLIADSILGSWLIKREGSRAWTALRTTLDRGRMPASELADGMLILVGGTLMLSPGFVTDLLGVLLIAPPTRPIGRRLLTRVVARRLGGPVGPSFGSGSGRSSSASYGAGGPSASSSATSDATRPGPDVVRGEVL